MNVQMDRLANKVRDGPDTIPNVPEYKTDFQIKINGEILYSNVAASLRSELTGRPLRTYWKSKYGWNDEPFNKVDWQSLEAYLKGISQQVRTNVLKLCTGWQYTRQRKNLFESRGKEDFEMEDDSCPLGCSDTDNTHHFLTCSSQPGFIKTNTELRCLDRFLTRLILLGLRSVLQQGYPVVFCGDSDLEIQAFEAYCDQEEIGWKHFLLGNNSHKWKEAMIDHYADLESTSDDKLPRHLSAKVWTKKLLCHVFHISLNRWQLHNKFHQAIKSDHDYREERESLLDEIETIIAKQHPVTPAVNTLFSHTYHSLASLPNMGIRNWLKSYGLVCKFVGPSLITFHFSQ